jgi:hypothetical protein
MSAHSDKSLSCAGSVLMQAKERLRAYSTIAVRTPRAIVEPVVQRMRRPALARQIDDLQNKEARSVRATTQLRRGPVDSYAAQAALRAAASQFSARL